MSSVKATQLRPGMVIQHEGQLFTIFSVDHRTPGNKRGSMQTRMRNLRTGAIIDYRFRAEEFVDRAILDEVEFEYLYNEGDDFHFMNTKNYEQMQMSREELGETVYYLIPSTIVKVEFFEEKAIGDDLPDTMDMKVIQTEPTLQKAAADFSPAGCAPNTRSKIASTYRSCRCRSKVCASAFESRTFAMRASFETRSWKLVSVSHAAMAFSCTALYASSRGMPLSTRSCNNWPEKTRPWVDSRFRSMRSGKTLIWPMTAAIFESI